MPTRAGQRCTRQPRRLHRTASLRHESSIESSSQSNQHTETLSSDHTENQDNDEPGPAIAHPQPIFIGPRHNGSTPIIESSEGSTVRSTPCPGPRQQTPQSDIDMPDASYHRSLPSQSENEHDGHVDSQSYLRTASPDSMQHLQHLTWRSGSNASTVLLHHNKRESNASTVRLHNATAENHRARLQASELEVEADREQLAELERVRDEMAARMETLEGRLVETHERPDTPSLLFLVVVVVLLMYACFCWWNWPEMSYIRKRRGEVLGL